MDKYRARACTTNLLVELLKERVVALKPLHEICKVRRKAMLHSIVSTGSIFQPPVGGVSKIGFGQIHVIDFEVQESL